MRAERAVLSEQRGRSMMDGWQVGAQSDCVMTARNGTETEENLRCLVILHLKGNSTSFTQMHYCIELHDG